MPLAYDKLLLNRGGGIIDVVQQAEQDDCAILAIGLGGTGTDCLRKLKEKVYNRVKPDNPGEAVPRYDHIKFLSVDTDAKGMNKAEGADGGLGQLDLASEFFDISFDNSISALFKTKSQELAKDKSYREWLQFKDIKANAADAGAGGIRQLGRFLLMEHAYDYLHTLEKEIQSALAGLDNASVYVHIFSGMGGGTGSGTFLDTCYLVRKAIENVGVASSMVMGYFFLPDVNLKNSVPPETQKYIKSNGYAAMQELDYCMSFEENGDSWHQQYPGIGVVADQRPPVDLCHLVSGVGSAGAMKKDPYSYAIEATTDYVMDFVVRAEDPTNFGLQSHHNNIVMATGQVQRPAGASYDYIAIGAAAAIIPYKQILTYLAAGTWKKMSGLAADKPSDKDVTDFMASIGLTFNSIQQRMSSSANMQFPAVPAKDGDVLSNRNIVVGHYNDLQARAEGSFAEMLKKLSSPLDGYGEGCGVPGSLMAEILKGLRGLMADPEKGPAYACAMGEAVKARLEGISASAAEQHGHLAFNMDDRIYPAYQTADRELTAMGNKALKIGLGQAVKKYQSCTREVALANAELKLYEQMQELCSVLGRETTKLMTNFAYPYLEMAQRLGVTFQADQDELTGAATGKDDEFEQPIVTIKDMEGNLNETLRQIDAKTVGHALLSMLLSEDGMKGWGPNGREALLAHCVSDFFIKQFNSWSAKSFTTYLQERYQTTDMTSLAGSVKNNLLNGIVTHAQPLFWSAMGYSVNDSVPVQYISIPTTAPVIAAAAEQLGKLGGVQPIVRKTNATDRMSVLTCYAGIPMWGYKGTEQYELDNAHNKGRHLYEEPAQVEGIEPPKDARDWTKLPSPLPVSKMGSGEHDPEFIDQAKRAKKDIEKALILDKDGKTGPDSIIRKAGDGSTFVIRTLDDAFMQNVRTEYDTAKDKSNDEKIAAQDRLHAMDANRSYATMTYTLATATADQGDVDNCTDMLARSPMYEEIVETEIARNEEIAKDIDDLTPHVDKNLQQFGEALFTGVIKLQVPVAYIEDEFGDQVKLTDRPSNGFEYGMVPLYQAFLSYKALDEDVKAKLEESAQETMKGELPQEALDAVKSSEEEIAATFKSRVKAFSNKFPYQAGELKSFIKDLRESLETFKMDNFID